MMQKNQQGYSLSSGQSFSKLSTHFLKLLLILSIIFLVACTNMDEKEQQVRSYHEHINELGQLLKQKLKTNNSDEQKETIKKDGIDLEKLRLPRTRFRRFTLAPSPQLNFRQFMSLSDCSLSRHIAFRNSPLGRMMLPAQALAYNHRFLKAAQQCIGKLEPKLDEELKKVIKFKQDQWPTLHWNAVWGGTPLAKFFSISWTRGRKIKGLDAQDEAQLVWLSKLKSDYTGQLSTELEQTLAQIPEYVGGYILYNAYYAWLFLKVTYQDLMTVAQLSALLKHTDSGACKAFETSMAEFAQAQIAMSKAYQQLEMLQRSFVGLIGIKDANYPSPKLTEFIERWLSLDHPQSIRVEFKSLIKAQVALWLEIKKNLMCS